MKVAKPGMDEEVEGKESRNGMNAARQEPGRARLQSCQSGLMKHAALAAEVNAGLITRVARILISTLREIFDEGAYARFLDRNQMSSSPQAYDCFLRERESAAARRVRCC